MSKTNIINDYKYGAFCIWKNDNIQPDNLEVWMPIGGFEQRNCISDNGRVLSLGRVMTAKDGFQRNYPDKALKLSPKPNGYTCARLYHEGGKSFEDHLVHRLVANHFIPNPDSLPVVNHLDQIRDNNHVENLDWVTVQQNLTYKGCHLKGAENRKKPVFQYTLDGDFIKKWSWVQEAHENGFYCGSIRKVCQGDLKSHRGYLWKYE